MKTTETEKVDWTILCQVGHVSEFLTDLKFNLLPTRLLSTTRFLKQTDQDAVFKTDRPSLFQNFGYYYYFFSILIHSNPNLI